MSNLLLNSVYPERRFIGFTRVDGTVHFLSCVQALLSSNSIVLDVGCGRGQSEEDPSPFRSQLRNFRAGGRKVIGIDVDPAGESNPLIDEFRKIDDVGQWPVADSSVQIVFADYVLEHVQDPQAFFREAVRVLQPNGYFCARTPNFLGYGAFLSWLVPNRLHENILARVQPEKKSVDIFPTVYRCNTKWRLKRTLRAAGFEGVVYSIEAEPPYLQSFPKLFRVASYVVPYFPSLLKSTLLVFGRKPDG